MLIKGENGRDNYLRAEIRIICRSIDQITVKQTSPQESATGSDDEWFSPSFLLSRVEVE